MPYVSAIALVMARPLVSLNGEGSSQVSWNCCLVLRLDGGENLGWIGDPVFLQNRQQAGRGVFGVQIDIASGDRRLRDGRAAQIELALDREALMLEHLRVQLGDDELFGEIFRADLDRRRRRTAAAGRERQSQQHANQYEPAQSSM